MTETSLVTAQLRALVNKEIVLSVVEIDKTLIQRFVEAVEDDNPLWTDEGYAAQGPYGGIVCPPTFLCTWMMSGDDRQENTGMPSKVYVDGGIEMEFLKPMRLGDVITSKLTVVEPRESVSKKHGPMILVPWEVVHENQLGEIVAKSKAWLIFG